MLRLVADDLTGALDAAAPFASPGRPVPVIWERALAAATGFALDAGSRDLAPEAAHALALADAALLRSGMPAFRKLDSRLRGHPLAEIGASIGAGGFRSTIIAPAFPAQGRITRAGRQLALVDGALGDCGVDLARLPGCRLVPAGTMPSGEGVMLCDAGSEADLALIAASQCAPPVLWCGSAGLARALAGSGAPVRWMAAPVLLLVGSDQGISARQLATARAAGIPAHGLDLPHGTSREMASAALWRLCGDLVAQPPPTTLLIAGGETLLTLCRALGTVSLTVVGEVMPGIPASTMVGGAWDGVRVVSKSGGFGDVSVWVDLMQQAEQP